MTFEIEATLAGRLLHDVYTNHSERPPMDDLITLAGNARYVLIGAATSGSQPLWAARNELTRRLVLEHDFNTIAIDAPWLDTYRVNRFVRGLGTDRSAIEALSDIELFQAWTWRNRELVSFLEWLRAHNLTVAEPLRTGFYGSDVFDLQRTITGALTYASERDAALIELARARYTCFEAFGRDPHVQRSGSSQPVWPELDRGEDVVVQTLRELQAQRGELLRRDGFTAADAFLCAEQNARVARESEHFYRTVFRGGAPAWNAHETQLADTLDALDRHLSRRGRQAKIIVWAHAAQIGDARATELHEHGQHNLGQLLRERHPGETFSVGLSTHAGEILAADEWGAPAQPTELPPAIPGSCEALCHAVGLPAFTLIPRHVSVPALLAEPRLQRAVGAIYRPTRERIAHCYHARLSRQLDALVHIDLTRPLEPLERRTSAARGRGETSPAG
ncbi:MAG: erythromycin esterase family protein [Polyangiales bacterium]